MSRYRIIDQSAMQFLTLTIIDWVDVFTRKVYKDIIIESLKYCQKEKGLNVFAYVIMSNHIHLIVNAKDGFILSDIIRDFKKFTAKNILLEIKNSPVESRKEWILHRFLYRGSQAANRQYQFWKPDNHPIELFELAVITQKIDYIHYNPVRAGWVDNPESYSYSSAINYNNGNGLLDVRVLELPMNWMGYINT